MRILLLVSMLAVLAACESSDSGPLKSPCAGLEDSPCGPKRPANAEWMRELA